MIRSTIYIIIIKSNNICNSIYNSISKCLTYIHKYKQQKFKFKILFILILFYFNEQE